MPFRDEILFGREPERAEAPAVTVAGEGVVPIEEVELSEISGEIMHAFDADVHADELTLPHEEFGRLLGQLTPTNVDTISADIAGEITERRRQLLEGIAEEITAEIITEEMISRAERKRAALERDLLRGQLTELAGIVFDKALEAPTSAKTYAHLCGALSNTLPGFVCEVISAHPVSAPPGGGQPLHHLSTLTRNITMQDRSGRYFGITLEPLNQPWSHLHIQIRLRGESMRLLNYRNT